MSDWLEQSVQIQVEAPLHLVWELWSDLRQMPRWMKWIESVEILEDEPELSRWTLAARGFTFSWIARTLVKIPHQTLQWESVDGLPTRGTARFYEQQANSLIELTFAYAKPRIVGKAMDKLFLGRIVESTIRSDLERFRQYAITVNSNVPIATRSSIPHL